MLYNIGTMAIPGAKVEERRSAANGEVPAVKLMIEKNLWLTRVRWLYTLFIFLFFFAYNQLSPDRLIGYRTLVLITALSVLGNTIFIFTLRRSQKFPTSEHNRDSFLSLASMQLDFDLVVLSLLIFFSGGFNSPIMVLFIFHIMASTFLIYHKKAFKNTLTAIALVIVIFFLNEGLAVSSQRITRMIVFNIILFFAFLISAYLSRNLRASEKSLQELLEETRELSVTDGLTNLYNHTHFFLLLNLQLEKAKRFNWPLSIIIFDVDDFKSYNDAHGHLKGSEALKNVASLMRKVFRGGDALARYGGDEFVAILPQSDKVGAYLAAERLREVVEAEPFFGEEKQPLGKITISTGIASYPEHGSATDELLNNADKALYAAKKHGRNRTVIYDKKDDPELEN